MSPSPFVLERYSTRNILSAVPFTGLDLAFSQRRTACSSAPINSPSRRCEIFISKRRNRNSAPLRGRGTSMTPNAIASCSPFLSSIDTPFPYSVSCSTRLFTRKILSSPQSECAAGLTSKMRERDKALPKYTCARGRDADSDRTVLKPVRDGSVLFSSRDVDRDAPAAAHPSEQKQR